MNSNKIYFIQTKNVQTNVRQCWVVSSPTEDEAQHYLVSDRWVNLKTHIVISSEQVLGMVDTEEYMDGIPYLKMHN